MLFVSSSLRASLFVPGSFVLLTGARVIPENRHPVSRFLQRLYYPWVSALMRACSADYG